MFSRFTEKAIQTIMLAQEEAKKFHHSYVGTEHILLGILDEGDNVVIKVLVEIGFTPEQIRTAIEERLEYGGISAEYGNIPFTQQAKQILSCAWDEARKLGHNYVNVEHIFLSIFRDPTSIAARVITEMGVSLNTVRDVLFKLLGNKVSTQQRIQTAIPTPTLDLYGRDLTQLALEDKLDPVIGRSKEIDRIIQILSRRTKNNPVLTGEPGVGKTAIVEGLAQKIFKAEVPIKLQEKRVITLDLGLLVAGTKYRGEFEDRVKKVMEEVRKAKNVILFIDELHTIIGTGGSEGSLDAANLFKPALARGELQCIGATTMDEYRKHIEGDGALERRFQSLHVDEPTKEEAIQILRGIKERYEEFHSVIITEESLVEAVELASRYITERFLPDKAVDLIDEAASKVMLSNSFGSKSVTQALHKEKDALLKEKSDSSVDKGDPSLAIIESKLADIEKKLAIAESVQKAPESNIVTEATVRDVVSAWTGIPIQTLTLEESKRLMMMEEDLKTKIVGQEEAIKGLCRAVKRAKVGLKNPNRPTGSFLFLGPSGVGKSELAKTLAEYLFGDRDAMVRVDMSEYMEKHTVSRLIGSPPGYVGYNEAGQLTEPVRRRPYSVVLFDELEKASPDVINILLQILEDGRVTDANGKTVNFKNTIVIMTSNVGSKFIEKETTFGFVDPKLKNDSNYNAIKVKLTDELRREFRPEFLNRIDDIIIFKLLDKEDITKILDIMLRDVLDRLSDRNIQITVDKKAKGFLVDKGFNQKQGARPLRRAIQEYFEDSLADTLLKDGVSKSGLTIKCSLKDDKLVFSVKKNKNPDPEQGKTLVRKEKEPSVQP